MLRKRIWIGLAAAGALALAIGTPLLAQSPTNFVTALLNTDAFKFDRPNVATNTFAKPGTIALTQNYVKVTPGSAGLGGTGYSNTFANDQGYLLFRLTGTMPYSYITLAPAPGDGAKECIFAAGGAITTAYVNANSGQSISNAVTTFSSNTGACYLYSLANKTWDRS